MISLELLLLRNQVAQSSDALAIVIEGLEADLKFDLIFK